MPIRHQLRLIVAYLSLDILLFLPMVVLLVIQRSAVVWLWVPLTMGGFFPVFSWVLHKSGLGTMSDVGLLLRPGWYRNFAVGASFSLLYLIALYIVRSRLAGFHITGRLPLQVYLVPQLWVAGIWLIAAVQEELLIRGFVLTVLIQRFSRPTAILLSAVVFALHHYNHWIGGPGLWIAQVFLHGLLYAVATVATGSLWLAIGFHWAWNVGGTLIEGFFRVPGAVTYELTNPVASTWLELCGDLILFLVTLWLSPRLAGIGAGARRARESGYRT